MYPRSRHYPDGIRAMINDVPTRYEYPLPRSAPSHGNIRRDRPNSVDRQRRAAPIPMVPGMVIVRVRVLVLVLVRGSPDFLTFEFMVRVLVLVRILVLLRSLTWNLSTQRVSPTTKNIQNLLSVLVLVPRLVPRTRTQVIGRVE